MSVFEQRLVSCGACGTATERTVGISINGGRSPALRQEILDGAFQTFTCDGCGVVAQADGPLVYVDMDARHFIGCFPRDWEAAWRLIECEPLDTWRRVMVEHAPARVRARSDGYLVRAVFGLPALREKLVAIDAGIDDRVLEALKLDLLRAGPPLTLDADSRPLLVRADDRELVFEVDDEPAGGHRFGVPRSRLERIEADRAAWAAAIRAVSAGPYVDVGRLLIAGTATRPELAA